MPISSEQADQCKQGANNTMSARIRIMPCLDMQNGRVVKGIHFVDIRDAGDPVECARAYCNSGADELALLDITATVEGRATGTFLRRSAGGGDYPAGCFHVSFRHHSHR
jgi:hypothetical protein